MYVAALLAMWWHTALLEEKGTIVTYLLLVMKDESKKERDCEANQN